MHKENTFIKPEQIEEIRRRREAAINEPFTTAVFGETGVGKTSTINASMGMNLKVSHVGPGTLRPEEISINRDGHKLIFRDMPGFGESISADARYLNDYLKAALESDVVIWMIQADRRSVTYDVATMQKLLANMHENEQVAFLSKLTVVLSKADSIAPKPWILCKMNDEAVFETSPETETLLDEKAAYFRKQLLEPFQDKIISRTFHDGRFNLQLGELTSDRYYAYYSGLMSLSTLNRLKSQYPEFTDIFVRLYQNTQPIYCSSRFHYNVTKLMRVVVDKIEGEANLRFRHFASQKTMNRVSWEKAKTFSNLVVYDAQKDDLVFNLEDID